MASKGAATVTVDSLVKFQYKKKFSFSNRHMNGDEEEDNGKKSLSDEEATSTKKAQHKGSAVLKQKKKKNADNSSSFSASFSSASSSDSDSSDDSRQKKKKKKQKKKDDSSDDEAEKRASKLKRLHRMFPLLPSKVVDKRWEESGYNAKKSIDLLLKEQENLNDSNKSFDIEEWSDGDEAIRSKNLEKKRKSVSTLNEPLKKKARKVVIASEDDDDNNTEINGDQSTKSSESNKKENKLSTSSLSSGLNDSTDEISKNKKKIKKKISIKLSSDEEEEEGDRKKNKKEESVSSNESDDGVSKKKSKKDKKKKSKKEKKKRRGNSSDEDQQDDDDFRRSDADNGSTDSADEDEINLTDEQKEALLTFFNNGSMEDIQSMVNISKNRLQKLLSLRPFQNYIDLHKKIREKSLANVIESAKEVIYARSIVNNLFTKCEEISQRMEKLVASLIESKTDDDNSNSGSDDVAKLEIKSQPALLNKSLSLKPYQLVGLNWLAIMHNEGLNGILADEMGLGKTCQTISFLAYLMEKNKHSKQMHLIIVPPSTLDNWIREISVWLPSFYFTVYQGNLDERRQLRYQILNNKFEKPLNAILTTYGLLSSTNEDKAFFRKLKLDYCVYDEAHMLKNMNSVRYQSLIKIQSRRKLLLTGTPLQNNLVELMSLLYFVMPDLFNNKTEYLVKIFKSKPANVDIDTFYNEKITQAKGIMKPFILRRIKTEVLKQLPKKTIEVIYCDMTQRQSKAYNSLIEYYKKRKDQLILQLEEKDKKKKEKVVKPSKSSITSEDIFEILQDDQKNQRKANEKIKEVEDSSSNILMELRKAANHPLLRRCIYTDEKLKEMARLVMKESSSDTVFEYVVEDMSVMSDFQLHKLCPLYKGLKGHELDDQTILSSGKFTILNSILEEKKEMNDRVLIFSQFVIMLDIIEEYLKIKKYKYIRLDGTTTITDRQDLIDLYNNDNEIFVFLLSTKAGGVGINLTAANVVIMHDIDFNPFNDKQAEDRCHRVGQTKEVQVYKLISKNSIDESMLKVQNKKIALGSDMHGENEEHESKTDMVSLLKEALNV